MVQFLLAVASPAAVKTAAPLPPEIQNFQFSTAPTTWLAQHAPWLTHTFAGLFVVSAVLLVILLAVQTTKQEGLTGTLGGRVESAYRGRVGFDEQLSRITTGVAIAFVLCATILSISGI